MQIEVLRNETVIDVTVPLNIPKVLSPAHFDGRPPSYYVLGGLVFTVMSDPYLDVRSGPSDGFPSVDMCAVVIY